MRKDKLFNGQLVFKSRSAAETRRIGEALGRLVQPGEVVALVGELGAGKTALVQGIAAGLEVTSARVASPTFTIVQEHSGRLPLFHFDWYRLVNQGELEEIGFSDYLRRGAVVVIEWADRFPEALPEARLEVELVVAAGRGGRRLTAAAHGGMAVARLQQWHDALCGQRR